MGWREDKGGSPGIARWLLLAAHSSASVLLALLTGVAALAVARLIQEVPDMRLETEASRLIDVSAVSGNPQEVRDIVDDFNASVRGSVGERRNNLTVKRLPPPAADVSASVLDSADRYVAYSQDLDSWAMYSGAEILGVPARVGWDDIDGCDEGVTVLDEFYGPVACQSPSGTIQPYGESRGVPGYAREIERLDLAPAELAALLRTLERNQYYEASLVVFNDGNGPARGVQIAAPEGFRLHDAQSVERRCSRSGLTSEERFSMPRQQRCQLVFRSARIGADGPEDISSNLAFSASAANRTPLADLPLNWLLLGVVGATAAYFGVYLFATSHDKIETHQLK